MDDSSQDEPPKPRYHTPTMPTSRALDAAIHGAPPMKKSRSSHSSSSSSSQVMSSKGHKPSKSYEDDLLHILRQFRSKPRYSSLPRGSSVRPSRKSSEDKHDTKGPSLADSQHPRSHSRGRSRESASTLLLSITTDRLAQETARANAAERKSSELLARIKTMHESRLDLERELIQIREELGLYKAQLDVAQKEILRAQVIVNDVEAQRVSAEKEAAKNRDAFRKLKEQRIISEATEEGRREGYIEGLARGRAMALAEREEQPRVLRPRRNTLDDRSRSYSSRTGSTISTSPGSTPTAIIPPRWTSQTPVPRSSSRPRATDVPPWVGPSRSQGTVGAAQAKTERKHFTSDHIPDTAHFRPRLPVPVLTTPDPFKVPPSQPQPPPERVPSRPSSSPEAIDILPPSPKSHQHRGSALSIHAQTPRVSHPEIVPLPDGYIPVLNKDNSISLPPPHEVAVSVPPVIDTDVAQTHSGESYANSAQGLGRARAGGSKIRDYANAGSRNGSDEDQAMINTPRSRRGRAMSVTSYGASTRISQLELVSPPREDDSERAYYVGRHHEGMGGRAQTPQTPTPLPRSRPRAQTQPQEMAAQWRSKNSDIGKLSSTSNFSASPSAYRERGGSISGRDRQTSRLTTREIERPKTVEPRIVGPRSPRVNGGPRESLTAHNNAQSTGDVPDNQHPIHHGPTGLNSETRTLRTEREFQPIVGSTSSAFPSPSSGAPQSQPQTLNASVKETKSPLSRTATSAATPDIGVEPPSVTPTSVSTGTMIDPVLLTPNPQSDHGPPAHSTPVRIEQQQPFVGYYSAPPFPIFDYTKYGMDMVQPNHSVVPPGFVAPLSPIPPMTNLRPFDPQSPPVKEGYSAGNFKQPIHGLHQPKQSTAGDYFSPAPLNRPISLFSDTD